MTDARRNWSPQKPACSSLVLAAAIDSLPKYRVDILLPLKYGASLRLKNRRWSSMIFRALVW